MKSVLLTTFLISTTIYCYFQYHKNLTSFKNINKSRCLIIDVNQVHVTINNITYSKYSARLQKQNIISNWVNTDNLTGFGQIIDCYYLNDKSNDIQVHQRYLTKYHQVYFYFPINLFACLWLVWLLFIYLDFFDKN